MPVAPSTQSDWVESRAASGPMRTGEGQAKAVVLRPERRLKASLPKLISENSTRVSKGSV